MTSLCTPELGTSSYDIESILLEPSAQEYFSRPGAHERLLRDRVRLNVYRAAINDVVSTGDVVMDIGAGTGALSLYAIEAGASVIYIVEENKMILAEAQKRLTKLDTNADLLFLPQRSTEISELELPAPPTCIVTETLGALAFNEGIVTSLTDARRLAASGCKFVPSKVELLVATYRALNCHPRSHDPFVSRRPWLHANIHETAQCIATWRAGDDAVTTTDVFVSIDEPKHFGLAFWVEATLSPKHILTSRPVVADGSWGMLLWNLSVTHGDFRLSCRIRSVFSGDSGRPYLRVADRGNISCMHIYQNLTRHEGIDMLLTLRRC